MARPLSKSMGSEKSMGSDSIDFEKVMNCYEIVFKKLVRYLGSE